VGGAVPLPDLTPDNPDRSVHQGVGRPQKGGRADMTPAIATDRKATAQGYATVPKRSDDRSTCRAQSAMATTATR